MGDVNWARVAGVVAVAVAYAPYFHARATTGEPVSVDDPRVRTAVESDGTEQLWGELLAGWPPAAASPPGGGTSGTPTVSHACFELAPTPTYVAGTAFVECRQVADAYWPQNTTTVDALAAGAATQGWAVNHRADWPAGDTAILAKDGRTVIVSDWGGDDTGTLHANLSYDVPLPAE